MAAAVDRRTRNGACLNQDEALTPEQALALFTGPATRPGAGPRAIHVGAVADLCLLDRPWRDAREDLAAVQVRTTIRAGTLIHHDPQ
jgi:predicted amidohydrolase YtcJ